MAGKDLAKRIAENQGKPHESKIRKEIRERGKGTGVYEKRPGDWFARYEDGSEGGVWGSKQAAERDMARYNAMTEEKTFLLEGNDLKIGGQWATNLYDRTIPSYLKKYVKQWGADVGRKKVGKPRYEVRVMNRALAWQSRPDGNHGLILHKWRYQSNL